MEAKEITWIDGAFGLERSSLILDPLDEKPKNISLSKDQREAITILEGLMDNSDVAEKDYKGNVGVLEDIWRDAVVEQSPDSSLKNNWGRFKNQLKKRELIKFENGLVRKGDL